MSVRPATPEDAPAIAALHVQSWRETYPGLLPEAYLARMTDDAMRGRREVERARSIRDPAILTLVAEHAGRVAGFVTGGAVRGDSAYGAELYALYLLRAAQGAGLGRALVRELARGLQARGHRDLMLWVLAENPTRGLYAHLGGTVLGEKTERVPEGELREVAYGWPDLSALL